MDPTDGRGRTTRSGPLARTRGPFSFIDAASREGSHRAQDEDSQGVPETLPGDRHRQTETAPGRQEAPAEPQDRQAQALAARRHYRRPQAGQEVRRDDGRPRLSDFSSKGTHQWYARAAARP